jgi:diaminopimelate epimerase
MSETATGGSPRVAVVVLNWNGLCNHGLVTVRMPGGTLSVEVRPDWSIRLQGPVEEVYAGAFSRELMDALKHLKA